MKKKISLVWFKRDLRLHDHTPLAAACASGMPVLPLYVVEPGYWLQPFASRRHWHFIHDCLIELRSDFAKLGQPLIVRTGPVLDVFKNLKNSFEIISIYGHEETSNLWGYQRDRNVRSWCRRQGISLYEYPTNGIVRCLHNRDIWAKIRSQRMLADVIPKPHSLSPISLPFGDIPTKDDALFGSSIPGHTQIGGRRAAVKTLNTFLTDRGSQYLYRLSAPGLSEIYCSRLSTHLAWGTLSTKEILKSVGKRCQQLNGTDGKIWKRNLSAFVSRLAWRCHFIQKMEDSPQIETHSMHPAFDCLLPAANGDVFFSAWSAGQTGYPFIDACMRNLITEGWITFRMRAMLVSFASYHLGLDWRCTGHFLARLFTDYEPGIHYSQLQMQSGITGINVVRIYNPVKQSMDHDPDGTFIRNWVPELEAVTTMWVHEPAKMNAQMQQKSGCVIGQHYPSPIVDHKIAVQAARARINAVRKTAGFRDDAAKVYAKLGSRKRRPSGGILKSNPNKNKLQQLSFFLDNT